MNYKEVKDLIDNGKQIPQIDNPHSYPVIFKHLFKLGILYIDMCDTVKFSHCISEISRLNYLSTHYTCSV